MLSNPGSCGLIYDILRRQALLLFRQLNKRSFRSKLHFLTLTKYLVRKSMVQDTTQKSPNIIFTRKLHKHNFRAHRKSVSKTSWSQKNLIEFAKYDFTMIILACQDNKIAVDNQSSDFTENFYSVQSKAGYFVGLFCQW